jgi:hypothetical protein
VSSRKIGILAEKSLHASIKRWYSEPGDKIEKKVDGFIIDIVRNGQLIEIQTGNFSQIRRKLVYLLRDHPVHLVHPIPIEKWIVRQTPEGEVMGRRRSPKRGKVVDIFPELVRIPNVVMHPHLIIEVLLTRQEEIRRNDGKGSRRRKKWSVHDNRLLEVVDAVTLATLGDFERLIPDSLKRPFTNRDLAVALERPLNIAQTMTYTLRRIGAISEVGKRGNAILYM